MSSNRLELLRSLVEQDPANAFTRYGLAMEYSKAGQYEAAMLEFHALLAAHPDYGAAYYHGGQALERLGRIDEARRLYMAGIEATTRKGDLHTRGELQAALDILGP